MESARILVAVDGTAAAQPAIEHGVALALERGLPLKGLFVIDTQWADFIGNDWQSSRNARQDFLDYIRREQEEQSRVAMRQFERAVARLPAASFSILAGDPAETLVAELKGGDADVLVMSRRVFQVSGRPKLKRLAKHVARHAEGEVVLFP